MSSADNGGLRGFVWTDGHLVDLGVVRPGGWNGSRATDVNKRGLVVGGSDVGNDEAHAILWVPAR